MKMNNLVSLIAGIAIVAGSAHAGTIDIGRPLPQVAIEKKGKMVPAYTVEDGKMVFKKGSEIKYESWNTADLVGKVQCVYHLAARLGTDKINEPLIDALIAAKLPETLPDSPYKTTTILNTDDALFGTAWKGTQQLEESQKDVPYALYVNDAEGKALKSWGLKPKGSAVIILNKEGKVIYFKDGKMTAAEIDTALGMIQKELGI